MLIKSKPSSSVFILNIRLTKWQLAIINENQMDEIAMGEIWHATKIQAREDKKSAKWDFKWYFQVFDQK